MRAKGCWRETKKDRTAALQGRTGIGKNDVFTGRLVVEQAQGARGFAFRATQQPGTYVHCELPNDHELQWLPIAAPAFLYLTEAIERQQRRAGSTKMERFLSPMSRAPQELNRRLRL